MTNSTKTSVRHAPRLTAAALPHGRYAGLIPLGCLLLLIWGAGFWLSRHVYQEREAVAFEFITWQAREAAGRIRRVLTEADQILLELRGVHASQPLVLDPERWGAARYPGGIAVLAPDGQVIAATARASTTGWSGLMTRLESATADEAMIGEPVPDKEGRGLLVPLARRVTGSDGAFAGLVMISLESEALSSLSPSMETFGGSVTVLTESGIVLSRTPVLRGLVGDRLLDPALSRAIHARAEGVGRGFSAAEGQERIHAHQHLEEMPVIVVASASHDMMFKSWKSLRRGIAAAAALATALIGLTGWFWRARKRRTDITGEILNVLLANTEHGVRMERADGTVAAVNAAGSVLRWESPAQRVSMVQAPAGHTPAGNTPAGQASADEPPPREERQHEDGGAVRITRHALKRGGTILIGTDLTARQMAEARITFLTHHDPLTGLPNRWHATSRVQALIEGRPATAPTAALILFDLDGFQDINDTLGQEAGDEVLTEIAARLRELTSDQDVVARLGGDEFLLFLDVPDDDETVSALSAYIPRVLSRPIAVRGQQVHLGASMGIAFHPRDGKDTSTLFRHADIALSRAKKAGRGRARVFAPAMMAAFEEHRMIESDLRRALENKELELRLQPQFSCDTLEITGFEALARWRHPVRGDISPAVFIPIAERSGLINPLGLWALEHACQIAAGWRVRRRMAVNLSPVQLRCETIEADIRAILHRTQFPAHLLELEVTESVLLDGDERTLETLHRLRAMDIRITLDDFGTGYSSLSYLRRFPFDKVKIDKSFIQGQGKDRMTRVILEGMIRLCSDLDLDVVGEGVETEAELNELRRLKCGEVQGFLLGRPLRPVAVEGFLARHARRSGARIDPRTVLAPPA